jgi:hypothetical protein
MRDRISRDGMTPTEDLHSAGDEDPIAAALTSALYRDADKAMRRWCRSRLPATSTAGFTAATLQTLCKQGFLRGIDGALGAIRTPDPRNRNPMLYPAELRVRRPHHSGESGKSQPRFPDFPRMQQYGTVAI